LSKDRIIYYDVLRIIAIFAVVFSHVSSQGIVDCFPSQEWVLRMVYDSFGRWSVPVFVMISGALFLDISKKITIKKLYSKNIFHIIYVFLFWSVIYAIYDGLYKNGLVGFVLGSIHGPFHFWFLKMLIGLYIIVPLLRMITQDQKLELYFILIAILTTFLIPLLFPIIGYFSTEAKDFIQNYYNSLELNIASGHVGYFVLGHYLSNYSLKPFVKNMIFIFGFISLIAVCLITYFVSNYSGSFYEAFLNSLNIFTLLEATAVFVFIKNINFSTRYYSFIIRFSKATFGIYIIHILLMHVVLDFWGIDSSLLNPVVFIPIYSVLVFVVSYTIVSVLMRIPIIKRFVL